MIDAPSGPAWNLFVVLVVVVAAPLLAERVRIPGVVGLIFGGFAIGPHALDLVGNDEVLANGGTVGVLYLMFLAGLELDLALFARVRRNAVMFGLITFTAPFVLGLLSGLIGGYGTGAIVLIGSLWASHTLVTYPIVRRHGLSANRAVATTVGATVITDTMALLVLAVVVGIHTGSASGPVLAGELLLGLAILLGACFLVLPVAARWFFKGVGHERTSRYIFVLAAFLGAAALADAVGIEGIVGAFFAGLALNRLVPNRSPLMERVEFFGAAFFIPVFLVSVGLLIVPGVVADGSTLGLAGLFLTAVIAGKLGAAIAARRLFPYSGAETGVVFGLSVSQAAATLAATIVGFQAGVLDGRVVNAAVVVIVCSLLIAAVATNRAAARVTPETTGEDGALGRAIVVPLGGEDDLAPLLQLAARVARGSGGIVVPLQVVTEAQAPRLAERRRSFESLVGRILHEGLEAEPVLRVDESTAAAIQHTLLEHEASLVLVRREIRPPALDAVFGSPADELASASPVPVAVAALAGGRPARVVLAMMPDGDQPDRASAAAVRFAHEVTGRDLPLEVVPRAGGRDGDARLLREARPGDVIVLAAPPSGAVFSPTAARLAAAGVSVVVLTGPHGSGAFATDARLGLEVVGRRG